MITYSKKKPILKKGKSISLGLQKNDVFKGARIEVWNDASSRETESQESWDRTNDEPGIDKDTAKGPDRKDTIGGKENDSNVKKVKMTNRPALTNISNQPKKKTKVKPPPSSSKLVKANTSKIKIYPDPRPIEGEQEPEWVITPRKLFSDYSSQDSDEIVLARGEFCSM